MLHADCCTQLLQVNVLHLMPVISLSLWHKVLALGLGFEIYVLGLCLDIQVLPLFLSLAFALASKVEFLSPSVEMIVLQELIQNAEDAGAQRIIFMLDHTSYGQREGMLHDPGLALYQV